MMRTRPLQLLTACLLASFLLGGGALSPPGQLRAENNMEEKGPTLAASAVVQAALDLADEGKLRDAQVLLGPLNEPLLESYLLWRAAVADSEEPSFSELSAFLARHPGWPYESSLVAEAEKRLHEGSAVLDDAGLAGWFQAHPPVSTEGALLALELHQRRGETDALKTRLVQTWRSHSLDAEQERLLLSRYGNLLTRDDNLARLETLLWRRDQAGAKRQANRLGGGYPELAEARLRLALNQVGVDAAIRAVPESFQNDPGLLYERADWRLRRNRVDGVVEILDPPPAELGDAERWWRMRHWAAREALDEGRIDLAYRLSINHGMDRGLGFAQGEWLAGWLALRYQDKPALALTHFETLYENVGTPISLGRAAYWAGRAAAAAGEAEKAKAWYLKAAEQTTTFYGQLGAAEAGIRQLRVWPVTAEAPGATAEGRSAFEATDRVQLIRTLARYQENERINAFLIGLRDEAKTPEAYRMVAELALDAERPDLALLTAKTAQTENIYLADFLYPTPPVAPVDVTSLAGTPEPALVLGLIRQESLFNKNAVSRVGARGLMQLMPGTAKLTAPKVGLRYDSARLTEDPDYNVALGRHYLAEMLERYDGQHILAIAAYNAGPGRVDEWLKRFGAPPSDPYGAIDWIERIPFYETRNYVQRVLEAMVVYRQRLQPGEQYALLLPDALR